MNHFELFDLPVRFNTPSPVLQQRYNELKGSVGADHERIDQAYKTLQDPDAVLKYILHMKGLISRDEHYEPDPQFTLEVMDINEELTELGLDENQEQLMNVEQKTNRLLLKIMEDVAPIMDGYEEDTATEEALLQVKEYYYQKKYLQGILDKIRGVRNIASP